MLLNVIEASTDASETKASIAFALQVFESRKAEKVLLGIKQRRIDKKRITKTETKRSDRAGSMKNIYKQIHRSYLRFVHVIQFILDISLSPPCVVM